MADGYDDVRIQKIQGLVPKAVKSLSISSVLKQTALTDANHLLLQFKPKIVQEQHLCVFCSASALRFIENPKA